MTGPQRDPRAVVLDEFQDRLGQGLAGSPEIQAVTDELLAAIDTATTRAADETGGPQFPRRINVAVSTDSVLAIDRLIAHAQVSLTEAVRQLLQYGDFLHRSIADEGADLLVIYPDGSRHDVVLLDDQPPQPEGPTS